MKKNQSLEFPCLSHQRRSSSFVPASLVGLGFFWVVLFLVGGWYVPWLWVGGFFFGGVIGLNVFLLRRYGRYALRRVVWEGERVELLVLDRDAESRIALPRSALRIARTGRHKGGIEGLSFSENEKELFCLWFLDRQKGDLERLVEIAKAQGSWEEGRRHIPLALVFLLLFFFAPVGLFFLWKHPSLSRRTQVLGTALVGLPYAGLGALALSLAPDPPLLAAIQDKDRLKVQGFLQEGIDVNAPVSLFRWRWMGGKVSSPYLAAAIRTKDWTLVRRLVEHGARLEANQEEIMRSLFVYGDQATMRFLGERWRLPWGWKDEVGDTGLHLSEDREVLTFLVCERGLSLGAKNLRGETPFAKALRQAHAWKRGRQEAKEEPKYRDLALFLRSLERQATSRSAREGQATGGGGRVLEGSTLRTSGKGCVTP